MTNHVYIASCTSDGGIHHYTQNKDGSLNELDFYPLKNPMYLQIKNGRMFVLLRDPFEGNENSGVFSFRIEKDGSLSDASEINSTLGKVACHLYVPDDMMPYCVNYVSGSVIKVPDNLAVHDGDGPVKPRQDKAHTHFVNASPDGKYIFVTDLGLDSIFVYDKELKEISRAKVPYGHGVRHLAYSPDGKTVFAANELSSTVSAFDYSDGKLTLRDTAYGLPGDFTQKSTMAAIRVRNGKIYASNRGHDSISCFDYKDGRLSLLYTEKVGGISPRDFDFIGDYAYCTNEVSNDTTVLKIENERLMPTEMKYQGKNPLCVVSIAL